MLNLMALNRIEEPDVDAVVEKHAHRLCSCQPKSFTGLILLPLHHRQGLLASNSWVALEKVFDASSKSQGVEKGSHRNPSASEPDRTPQRVGGADKYAIQSFGNLH